MGITYLHVFLICTILLCTEFDPSRGGLFRRRRRRRCGPVHCVWHGWSAWGACAHPCGSTGTQTRSRSISINPSCGGHGCSGPATETQACNRFCYNAATPQPGYCACTEPFWDICCDKRKSEIMIRQKQILLYYTTD